MANVLINFDGVFISDVNGQKSDKEEQKNDEGSVVINDPKLKNTTCFFLINFIKLR